jgi:hypothetical protein
VNNGACTGNYSRGVHARDMTDARKRVKYTNPLLFGPSFAHQTSPHSLALCSCAAHQASIMRINGQRKIIIAAEHDIQFGEEITYDYKLPLESKDKKIPCHCGALICKGTMN